MEDELAIILVIAGLLGMIGNALAIGVAVGVVLVVGNVRPGWQLACRDKLVHDVAGEGFDHCDGMKGL